jgi:hypothetical protein
MSTLYEEIRAKKAIWEHEEVKNIIPFISEQLYSSKTQLVFELIQNAEDACSRLSRQGVKQDYFIHFNLNPGYLNVYHNGIPFDNEDVDSICSVLRGTKTEDASLIGKFGIGFKSVYQYTVEPSIYSNNSIDDERHSFCIKKFVLPYKIPLSEDIDEDQTLINIPFNHPKKTSKEAYNEINEKLRNLSIRSILFLNSISEITYSNDHERGLYKRTESQKEGHKQITLLHRTNNQDRTEKWILFEKHIDNNTTQPKVEIAFLLADNKKTIIPTKPSNLYTYFETDKNTNFNFLIHGPFHTTPARDNIRPDKWNEKILSEVSNLIAETLPKLKKLEYLNISFLGTLPINPELYVDTIFKSIYDRVKKEMLDHKYLPIYRGGYSNPENVFLAQISQLRELLTPFDLNDFYYKEGKWLDEDISLRRTPILRQYLLNELGILEITPDNFGRILSSTNLCNKSDEWLTKLYKFLISRKGLYQKGTKYDREGAFWNKPIFRTSKNEQTAGFDLEGNPLIYLPSNSGQGTLPVLKANFMNTPTNVDFFHKFGLKKQDKSDLIIKTILPKYGKRIIPRKENIDDVYTILDTVNKITNKKKKDELLSIIQETKILHATNSEGKSEYKKPREIYLSETYSSDNSIELFYEGYADVWFLSDRYKEKASLSELVELGVHIDIIVSYKIPWFMGMVELTKPWSDHIRGLNGFDPDANIQGLEHVLNKITPEKSQILWNLLKLHKDLIYGVLEESSRQDFRYSKKTSHFSNMGKMLIEHKWLPDKKNVFIKTSDIRLTALNDNYEKSSADAKYISKKLHMKQEIDEEILSRMNASEKTLLQTYHMLSEEKQREAIALMEKLTEEYEYRPLDPVTVESVEEIRKRFADRLSSYVDKSLTNLKDEIFPVMMTQEDEEELIRKYGENMGTYLKENIMRYRNSMKTEAVVTARIPPKQFLISQYDGHCQICRTKLDVGAGKNPYINEYKIEEKRRRHPWADEPWNNLGLCPNCHALAKHGGLNLQRLVRLANDIIIQEMASEFIEERGKQGYLVNIELAGTPKTLFYTQRHMSYITAFLFFNS